MPAAPPSSRSGGLTKLFDSLLTGTAASIDTGANGVPAGYAALEVYALLRTNEAAVGSSTSVTVNGDSSALYDAENVSAVNVTATAAIALSQTAWSLVTAGASALASEFAAVRMTLPFYAETTAFKTGSWSTYATDTTANSNRVKLYAIGYRSTAAITRLAFAPTNGGSLFIAGSHVTIYGVS